MTSVCHTFCVTLSRHLFSDVIDPLMTSLDWDRARGHIGIQLSSSCIPTSVERSVEVAVPPCVDAVGSDPEAHSINHDTIFARRRNSFVEIIDAVEQASSLIRIDDGIRNVGIDIDSCCRDVALLSDYAAHPDFSCIEDRPRRVRIERRQTPNRKQPLCSVAPQRRRNRERLQDSLFGALKISNYPKSSAASGFGSDASVCAAPSLRFGGCVRA